MTTLWNTCDVAQPAASPASASTAPIWQTRAMAIFDDVNNQMKDALRAQQKLRLQALRNIRAAFLTRLKEDGSQTLSDADCVPILRRLEKQRKESIEAFEAGGRTEQAAAEREELAIILGFLPSQASEDTVRGWVKEAIAESGATSAKDVGKVMSAVMKAHKGDVDGNVARKLATELLSG